MAKPKAVSAILQHPVVAARVQLLDARLRVVVEGRTRSGETRLHQVLLAPADERRQLGIPRPPQRRPGKVRGHAQRLEVEGEEGIHVVHRRAPDSEHIPRCSHLLGGSADARERAAGDAQRRPGDVLQLLRRLHEKDSVPAMRRHGDDGAVAEGRRIRRLQRLAAIREAAASRIGAQEHRRLPVGREKRFEGRLVAGAQDPDHGGLVAVRNVLRSATPTRRRVGKPHTPVGAGFH